jgi:hypothetical protein
MPIYVSEENQEKIFKIIVTLQQKSPTEPVRKKDVITWLKKHTKSTDDAIKKLVTRSFAKLSEKSTRANARIEKVGKQYWIPEYKKRNEKRLLKIERQTAEGVRKLEKSLELKEKHNKELIKKKLDLETLVEIAEPYLEVIDYSETEEDKELFMKWYGKMIQNMLNQEEKAFEKDWQEYLKTGKVTQRLKDNFGQNFDTHP